MLRDLVEMLAGLPRPIKDTAIWFLVKRFEHALRRGKFRVLFVVGHMRSGSSLLVHILNTNPGVMGFGETHRSYRTSRDFAWLALDVCRFFRKVGISGLYVMDKVLNDYVENPGLLESDRVRLVFLVRHPREALPSLIRFRPRDVENEPQALEYYVNQLRTMKRYARIKRDSERALFLTHHDLIHETNRVLPALRSFLDLGQPLSESYELIPVTGHKGPGDDSPEIRTGRVVRRKKPRPSIPLSPRTRQRARRAFERCLATLPQYCSRAGPIR